MILNSGSFRDPAGCVFSYQDNIYRSIFSLGAKDYISARDQGIFDQLIKNGLLQPHLEISKFDFAPSGTQYCIKYNKIPMISYPWEWSFSMLKDAALLHLNVMEILIPKGFWLRDANPYNIQFIGSKAQLIDTLSVGERVPNKPWVAYAQFCSNFLAPLAAAAYCDIKTLGLWNKYINGFPLDMAVKMMPLQKRLKPGIWLHLYLHSLLQANADRKENLNKVNSFEAPKVSDFSLLGLIRSLQRTLSSLKWQPTSRVWKDYTSIRTYRDEDVITKTKFVEHVIDQVKPGTVWDLGGNTGEFSQIAANQGAYIVSIDSDPACTEFLYRNRKTQNDAKNILPLTIDLSNPSPGMGWNNKERLSLSERGPADLALALALIHHLVFSSNVPLPLIAEWFSNITGSLLIEFIPPTDLMVKHLLLARGEEHLPYSQDLFVASFNKYFNMKEQVVLNNGRILFEYLHK